MKNWPTTLRLLLLGAEPGRPYVVFVSVLCSPNSVVIGPVTSDEHGLVTITRRTLVSRLEQERRDYPMDYKNAKLALPKQLAVDVQSRESIHRRAAAIAPFFPEEAAKLWTTLDTDATFLEGERRCLIDVTGDKEEFVIDPIRCSTS